MSVPMEVITHTRRVCALYKRLARNYLAWYSDRAVWRYHVTMLRAEFDKNKNEKDMVKVIKLVEKGEEKLKSELHYAPRIFPKSPGGVAYARNLVIPDSAIDYWDPVEKAFFPEYFAKREQRKKEYTELWEKKYGKVNPKDYEVHH